MRGVTDWREIGEIMRAQQAKKETDNVSGRYIKIGNEIFPIESSVGETLKKCKNKLKKTLGGFSIVIVAKVAVETGD